MKKNLVLNATAVLSFILCVLGVLTKIFTEGASSQILQYSVYGAVALSCVFALVVYFTGDKKDLANADGIYNAGIFAPLCFAIAMLLLCEGGFYCGKWVKYMDTYQPMKSFNWLVPFAVLSGIYFAIVGFEILSRKNGVASKLFGIFSPIFVCARAISVFFESFKTPADIGVKLEMVAMCAAALVVMVLCAMRAGANIAIRRVKAVSVLFCTVCSAAPLPEFAELIISGGQSLAFENLIWNIQLVMLWLFSFVTLVRAFLKDAVLEEEPPVTEQEQNPELDIFISDIPEEKEEEE